MSTGTLRRHYAVPRVATPQLPAVVSREAHEEALHAQALQYEAQIRGLREAHEEALHAQARMTEGAAGAPSVESAVTKPDPAIPSQQNQQRRK